MNRRAIRLLLAACGGLALQAAAAEPPLAIGLTAEFGIQDSQAAQSIEKGILLAIDEINAAGGVLGGRRLVLDKRDDRGLPARALDNLADLAARPEVVAVFCGRFSPVALELAPVANHAGIPLLDPWAAADRIVPDKRASYVFRLSLTDSWAMAHLLDQAHRRGLRQVALLLPNTAWGRSSEAAAVAHARKRRGPRFRSYWYNWGDTEFTGRLSQIRQEGAQAIILVANEFEGVPIVRQMAGLPPAERLPLLAHWGISAGDFAALAGPALAAVDLGVVQTFSFHGARGPVAERVRTGHARLFGQDIAGLRAVVGFAHAYDFTHLLARAIEAAGSGERKAVRDALERIDGHAGLLRHYRRPFAPGDHEALDPSQLFMARFARDGSLRPDQGK